MNENNVYAKPVFEDVCNLLIKHLDQYGTRSMTLSTWADIQHTVTDETFEVHLYDIDRIKIEQLVQLCMTHACYFSSQIAKSERETFIVLTFLWVDPNDSPIRANATFECSSTNSNRLACRNERPSFSRLLFIMLGIALTVCAIYIKNKYVSSYFFFHDKGLTMNNDISLSSKLPRGAKIVEARERILMDNCNVDHVDRNEKDKVLNICRELLNMANNVPSLTIYCTDDTHKTIVSLMGWSDRMSMPDFTTQLFNVQLRKPVFSSLLDLIFNPKTGEMELHVQKTNAKALADLDRARKQYSTDSRPSTEGRRHPAAALLHHAAPRRHVDDDEEFIVEPEANRNSDIQAYVNEQRHHALESRVGQPRRRRPFIPGVNKDK